ncbi:MAG: beta-galactosidase small subunit [Chitinophagaceae bacterium]
MTITKGADKLSFTAGAISGEFDTKAGRFTRYGAGSGLRLNSFPEPCFWRAPTDNDFGNNMPERLGIWRNAGSARQVKSVTVGEKTDSGVAIKVVYDLTGIAVPYTIDYLLQNDGSIKLTASIDLTGRDLPELPRFGMRTQLPGRFDSLSWYGRGPWENYTDRHEASFVGLYTGNVKDQYFAGYIRPQESGNKTDTRWLQLTDKDGYGFKIEGLQPLGFSAINHSIEDLDPGFSKKQQHPTDLPPRADVFLTIDLAQRGLGGDNSWGALPHQQYRLVNKKYSYSYIISLIGK